MRWWLSVGVDFETNKEELNGTTGIDLGIKDLAVLSTGKKYSNINKTKTVKKTNKRLLRLQRRASKKYLIKERTSNLIKLEKLILKTYKRLTNIRQNHIHQMTTEIVKAKLSEVVIEDLNVVGMMKNKHLSKAIANQKLSEVRRQLEYKCLFIGTKLTVASRWFPSSKLCSQCGVIKKDLKLSDRTYKCECGLEIDRDLNAAINLNKLAV